MSGAASRAKGSSMRIVFMGGRVWARAGGAPAKRADGVQGRIPAWEGSGFPVGRVPWRKGPTTAACQAVNFARRGGCGAAAIGKSWADFGGRGPAGGGFGPREANGGVGLACGALLECGPDGVF